MPPAAPPTRRPPRSRRPIVVIAVLDAVLLLFPPLGWWLADGDATVALAFMLGSGLLVVLSVVAIHHLDASGDDR